MLMFWSPEGWPPEAQASCIAGGLAGTGDGEAVKGHIVDQNYGMCKCRSESMTTIREFQSHVGKMSAHGCSIDVLCKYVRWVVRTGRVLKVGVLRFHLVLNPEICHRQWRFLPSPGGGRSL